MNWLLIDMSGWTESLLRKGERQSEPGAPSSERGSLNCSRHLPQEQEQSNPIYGIKWELLHLAVLFQYLHQYKSEHRGETALVFQTFLSTDDQKAWEKKPSSSLDTIKKHHPLCPCRQLSSSSQLIISAAIFHSPSPVPKEIPFVTGLLQSLYSMPKLPLACGRFSWSTASGTILCVCFDKNKVTLFTKFMKHLPPSFLRKFCLLI